MPALQDGLPVRLTYLLYFLSNPLTLSLWLLIHAECKPHCFNISRLQEKEHLQNKITRSNSDVAFSLVSARFFCYSTLFSSPYEELSFLGN